MLHKNSIYELVTLSPFNSIDYFNRNALALSLRCEIIVCATRTHKFDKVERMKANKLNGKEVKGKKIDPIYKN